MRASCSSAGRSINCDAERPIAESAFAAFDAGSAAATSVVESLRRPASRAPWLTSESCAAYCSRERASVVMPSLEARMPVASAESMADLTSAPVAATAAVAVTALHFRAAPLMDFRSFCQPSASRKDDCSVSRAERCSDSSCSCVTLMARCAPVASPVIRMPVLNSLLAIRSPFSRVQHITRRRLHDSHALEHSRPLGIRYAI